MRISELMLILAEVKEKHGDLVVTQHQWNDTLVPHIVEGVEVLTVRPHYSRKGIVQTYAINKHIRNGGWGGGGMFVAKYMKEILRRPLEQVAHIYYDRA